MKNDYIKIAKNVAKNYGFSFKVSSNQPNHESLDVCAGHHFSACWVKFYVNGGDVIGMTHKDDLQDLFHNWLQRWYNKKESKQYDFNEFIARYKKVA